MPEPVFMGTTTVRTMRENPRIYNGLSSKYRLRIQNPAPCCRVCTMLRPPRLAGRMRRYVIHESPPLSSCGRVDPTPNFCRYITIQTYSTLADSSPLRTRSSSPFDFHNCSIGDLAIGLPFHPRATMTWKWFRIQKGWWERSPWS